MSSRLPTSALRCLLIGGLLAGLEVVAHAGTTRCVLPVPDGGDSTPTPANLTGRISGVGQQFVTVTPIKGEHAVKVAYGTQTQFYSAFGGDYEPSELAPGQRVWVWYVGCKSSGHGEQKAAYLQLYSRDPNDQPK